MDVNGSASRKPSGSSSHSAGHSPNASPGAAASRRLASGGSGTLFGIGMKNLNNGWQVWPPGATSNAQRAASASSSVSNVEAGGPGSESLSRQLGEQWSAPRPAASSAWDMAGNGLDANGSPHKKDSGQLLARQRQATTPHATALSTPRSVSLPSAGEELAHSLLESDDRQGKGLSQQRFDNTANKTFSTNASPQNKPSPYTHSSFQYPNVSSLYASNGTSGYDLNGSAPMDEVTQGLRAMTVQDPYNSSFRVDQNLNNVQNGHISLPQQIRPPVPPVRAPSYNTYPQQSEFPTTYYGNGPGKLSPDVLCSVFF
ncbi:hypothetical protein SISSUDRAFT_146251 [Sistotremastrum suecicum HHB10207 ss-3]|uniref:Uncharacterized protein n=1 Tax=Sistotremastrum suecicum HHB10207 ss-3 TaxID=1314776 RepID=A0A166GVU4_9AGAM|nr:hypothetical protein SISSUDRAFT_146251 [Sistotremastrum suecicum HHB10207 ss-3]